jgi:hypothetical protein
LFLGAISCCTLYLFIRRKGGKKDAVPIRARALDSSDDCHCEERSNHITNFYQQEIQKTLFERVAFFCGIKRKRNLTIEILTHEYFYPVWD